MNMEHRLESFEKNIPLNWKTTSIWRYLDKVAKLMDEEKVADVMHLYFRKAFDIMSDKTLLENFIEVVMENNSVMQIENKH